MFLTHRQVWGVSVIFNTKNCESINYLCTWPLPVDHRDLNAKNSITMSLNCCRTTTRLHVFRMRTVLNVHKRKTPRCSLSSTGPTFKTDIRRQIGKGGGECPPVSDSYLDWQRQTCQSGWVFVFSPFSTALTVPADHPEVCRFHQFYPGTRPADINYQELSQMLSLKAFVSLHIQIKSIHPYFYCCFFS